MTVATAIPLNPTFNERLTGMSQSQKIRLALGIFLLLAIGAIGLVMGRDAEWRVLYANLADKDGGAIIAQLSQMNVPYKHAPGGGAILVPANRVHDTRLRLASQGLPKGSISGFEVMEANRFGMTQFQERLTFQRGLEGELTRSIQSLLSVQSARVHLALPNQNGFFREQQKPSASVLISLNSGYTLDRNQLAGIIHLVASSVPEMSPGAVSVLDDSGKLLSAPSDSQSGASGVADAQQLQYVQQLEQMHSRRILDMLEPVVGRQNIKAQVAAEVDFSQTEQTSELHKPNQSADSSAVRSQQTVESSNGSSAAGASGVPGATTNQPPAATSAPINATTQTVAPGGASPTGNTKRESITNYEVDKTIKVVKAGTGVIKRLSAAVVLNHQTVTDDKGKTTTTPLSEQQLEKMTSLVREAIGFSKERGDSVSLMNAPFVKEKITVVELPLWRQAEVQDMARSLGWPVGALLFSALVLMGAVRPGLKALANPPDAWHNNQVDALVAEETERPLLPAPNRSGNDSLVLASDLALEDARKLTRDNPTAVANIVKTWMNDESPS
jgi:flagellar M-ring protein FliF